MIPISNISCVTTEKIYHRFELRIFFKNIDSPGVTFSTKLTPLDGIKESTTDSQVTLSTGYVYNLDNLNGRYAKDFNGQYIEFLPLLEIYNAIEKQLGETA